MALELMVCYNIFHIKKISVKKLIIQNIPLTEKLKVLEFRC